MKKITICDVTMKAASRNAFDFSFKEKIEIAKLLDRLRMDVIVLDEIKNVKVDSLRIKSIVAAVENCKLAVPVSLTKESVDATWEALKDAKNARLQIIAPVSVAQMEYISHKKPEAMLAAIDETIRYAKALGSEIEFIAEDATRADEEFLAQVFKCAVAAGADVVTICDVAGEIIPVELKAFLAKIKEAVPELKNVKLGFGCADTISLASACAMAAMANGCDELKVTTYPLNRVLGKDILSILNKKKEKFQVETSVSLVEIDRIMDRISAFFEKNKIDEAPATLNLSASQAAEIKLTKSNTKDDVAAACEELGYDLTQDDIDAIWETFQEVKKDEIGTKELEAIIASSATQVPPTYTIKGYSISLSSNNRSMAQMKLEKNGEEKECVALGDGPIDAAFSALSKLFGTSFELDDFQVRAVTKGTTAMGEAITKLRSEGKLYSGRGISTDIVGASIYAYVNAVNKIAYEEDN